MGKRSLLSRCPSYNVTSRTVQNFNNFESVLKINPLKDKFNPICNLLALLGAHHIFHVSGLRVNGDTAILKQELFLFIAFANISL